MDNLWFLQKMELLNLFRMFLATGQLFCKYSQLYIIYFAHALTHIATRVRLLYFFFFIPGAGHGAMVRAWRFVDVAACRAVSNPAWCRIFREISCLFPLNLRTLLRWCVLGQDTSPSNASLDSGENEYLVGQKWQCVR